MKLLSVAALTSLVATSVMGGSCPKESTCIQEECSNFQVSKRVFIGNYLDNMQGKNPILEADCIDRHGTKVFTWLELKHCIVNRNGQMYWGYNGNYDCNDCNIKERKVNSDPVIMSCWCPDGSRDYTEINLADGIWHYDGVIGCYSWDGHKQPLAPVKKRSNVPELPAEAAAAVEARDAEDDISFSPQDPGLTDDPVGANHHRTPAEPRDAKKPPSRLPIPGPPLRHWIPQPVPKIPARSDDVVDHEEREDVEGGGAQRFRRF